MTDDNDPLESDAVRSTESAYAEMCNERDREAAEERIAALATIATIVGSGGLDDVDLIVKGVRELQAQYREIKSDMATLAGKVEQYKDVQVMTLADRRMIEHYKALVDKNRELERKVSEYEEKPESAPIFTESKVVDVQVDGESVGFIVPTTYAPAILPLTDTPAGRISQISDDDIFDDSTVHYDAEGTCTAACGDETSRGYTRNPHRITCPACRAKAAAGWTVDDTATWTKNPAYEPLAYLDKVGYLVEECGEVLAAVGKTIRWGLESVNPTLPPEQQETNRNWILRELPDLRKAIAIFKAAITLVPEAQP